MSDSPKSPARKSLDYAESLGVNTVYDAALKARGELDETLTALSEKRDKRRFLETQKIDREMEILGDEASHHPDMSVAAMERHLKVLYHNDTLLKGIREGLAQIADDLDGLEFDKQMAETDIKITTSRLNELGGYLQFMAVVKQAAEARKASEANKNNPDPWRTTE